MIVRDWPFGQTYSSLRFLLDGKQLMRYCSLIAFTFLASSLILSETSPAESRVLIEDTEHYPRNGEGSMIALKNGRLLLVYTQWYSNSNEGVGLATGDHDPARLAEIHSDDGGKTWSKPKVVQENLGKKNIMSSSLVETASGKLLLIYIHIDSDRFANLKVKESNDNGETWSEPRPLSQGKNGLIFAVNSAAIRLESGRILVAAYGSPSAWQDDEHFISYSYYSDDEGKSWHKSDNEIDCPLRGAMEPDIEQLRDGRIMMLIRTQTSRMYRAYSSDEGRTWTKAEKTDIVHPESSIQVQRIPGANALVLFWTNAVDPSVHHNGPRTPLTMGISHDEGLTWKSITNIETDPKGSYCYLTMAFLKDTMHLAYYGPGGLRYRAIDTKSLLKASP